MLRDNTTPSRSSFAASFGPRIAARCLCILALSLSGCNHAPEATADRGAVARSRIRPIDTEPAVAERVGRAALQEIGYDKIMRLALEEKWIDDTPPSAANVLAQGAEAIGFVGVFTRYAVAAGVASQVDSPAPGPGDVVAVGILVIGLVDAGLLGGAIWASITRTDPITGTTAAPPIPGAVAAATAAPTTTVPTMPTTLPLPDQELWRKCNKLHEAYKAAQKEAGSRYSSTKPLKNALMNNR